MRSSRTASCSRCRTTSASTTTPFRAAPARDTPPEIPDDDSTTPAWRSRPALRGVSAVCSWKSGGQHVVLSGRARRPSGPDGGRLTAPAGEQHDDALLVVDDPGDLRGEEQLSLPARGAVVVEHGKAPPSVFFGPRRPVVGQG